MLHPRLQCLHCNSYFTPHALVRPGGGESRIPFAKELFPLTRGTVDQNPTETASCRGIFNYCRWSGWRNIAVMLRDQKIKLQSIYASPTQLCSPAQLCWACCAKVQGLREQRPLFVTCPCDKKAHSLEQEARLSIMTRNHLKTNVNRPQASLPGNCWVFLTFSQLFCCGGCNLAAPVALLERRLLDETTGWMKLGCFREMSENSLTAEQQQTCSDGLSTIRWMLLPFSKY